mgnify:CR=1 FL=1
MNSFNKYILAQLVVGMVLVTAGLTCIIWLTQSLRLVEMIVSRGISTSTFLQLNLLLLPNFLTIVLPIALFIVIIFVYSKMISDRELVVMRASGQSQVGLSLPAVTLTLAIVAIGYALNLYFLPQSYRMFREMQWKVMDSFSRVMLQAGTFNEISKNITVYVRERTADGQLHGILVHDARDPENPVTHLAERGALVESDNGSRVVMFNGNRQSVDAQTHQLSILYFDRYIFEIEGNRQNISGRYREARERSLYELFNLQDLPDIDPRDVGKFTVEGHKRLLSPISSMGYTMIALAFLISGSFTRRTQSRRILLASVSAALFLGTMLALENAAAKNLALIPLMYGLSAVPIFSGLYFVLRMPGTKRTGLAEMAEMAEKAT